MQHETAQQTQARLLDVIAHADFEVLPGLYAFVPLLRGALKIRENALACVRAGVLWSELVPVGAPPPTLGHPRLISLPPLAGTRLFPDLAWRLRTSLSACLAPLAPLTFHGARGMSLTALPPAPVPEDLDGFPREHVLEQTKPLGRTATDDDQGGHRGRLP